MNEYLKSSIQNGELVLFLGAGASRGCKTANNQNVLDGYGLAKELALRASLPYEDEALDDVYAAVRSNLESRLDPILEEQFRNITPSIEYIRLAEYAWRRIYTLNIDDGLERAFRSSKQKIHVRLSSDSIEDRDQFFGRLDVIKLNGSIDRLSDGIIFSSAEYAKATSRSRPWYEQCAVDFVRAPFLFIGTKLNEPLLKFHIERYKHLSGKVGGKSYVITPSATEIQRTSLLQYNIVHIEGTLSDFTDWLGREFPDQITPIELATRSIPQYAGLLAVDNRTAYLNLFVGVSLVKRDMTAPAGGSPGSIRPFYKGFQPTWADIVEGVPADLDSLSYGLRMVGKFSEPNKVIPFIGPAGSGKSTLLMQLCYSLCSRANVAVYFIGEPLKDLAKTLEELEKTSLNANLVYVAIDNVDLMSDSLSKVINSGRLSKTVFVCAERENSWAKRAKNKLGIYTIPAIFVREFSERDAANILDKLERFGSWTILGQMTAKNRVKALVNGAKKQLLIALLEATYGRGFEKIIESEYADLSCREERMFFLTVGVVTDRHIDAPIDLIDRALSCLGILSRSLVLTDALAGIVIRNGDRLSVRHPVYVRHILEHVVDPEMTSEAIDGLLQAFSYYKAPVIKHLSKIEATIYKGLINHKFLWEVLKGRETLIVSLYKRLEKLFELDGLFWLQYGLALRDFHNDEEALAKFRTAFSAYPMPHTQHALGQQLLILGGKGLDPNVAIAYVDEARSLLEPLDEIIDSDDTYPIVTLAEGHTATVRSIKGDAEARLVAKSYIASLKSRCDALPENTRLRECHERMFKYAVTGTWME